MKKDKNLTSSEKIAARTESFFAKNARLLAIIGIIVVVLCVVIAVVSITSNSSRDKIATATYNLEQDYYNLLVMDETSDEYNTASSEFIASADGTIQLQVNSLLLPMPSLPRLVQVTMQVSRQSICLVFITTMLKTGQMLSHTSSRS